MLNCKPSFCYIAPTSLLDVTTVSKTHLVLAHLVDSADTAYTEFYKQRSKDGDYLIIDNSAYELKEPYSPDKLLDLAGLCGAHAIVLPDYPFKPGHVTIDAARDFIPQFKEAGFDTFFVPQSETDDIEDWIQTYKWAANNPDIDIIGMSILGIPNADTSIDPTFARVVMTKILQERKLFNPAKHHHYLGLNGGPATEIPSLIRMNVLNTIDSSGPIWSAILGHEYTNNSDSLLSTKKPKMPVDFYMSAPKDVATLKRIQHNIQLTEKLFDNTEQEKWYAED